MRSAQRLGGPVVLLVILAAGLTTAQEWKGKPDLRRPLPYPTERKASPADKPFAPDRLIVRFRPGRSSAARAAIHKRGKGHIYRQLRTLPDVEVVRIEPGTDAFQALREYRRQADILYAEPDHRRTLQDVVPNDPMFNGLWGMRNTGQSGGTIGADIDAGKAWVLSTGSSDVVVGTIDTGVDWNHPDLAANIYRNDGDCLANGIDDDGNGYIDDCHGFNGVAEQGDPIDTYGHGTHVAGTIGAVGNNALGVVGVNWRVKVLACKTDDEAGYLYDSAIIACLDYMAEMKDAGVNIVATNNSYSGGGHSQALDDAIREHMLRGILFVAAAGNYGIDNDLYGVYPADTQLPNVIAVAATDRKDLRAYFSDYGRHTVHLGAPGVAITSTVPGGGYETWDGTSMATPHVVGTAALLKAYDPALDWIGIKNRILAGGDPAASMASTITGRRLNAYGAMTCAGREVTQRLWPSKSYMYASAGEPVTLAMLHIVCANPAGPLSLTIDNGPTIVMRDDGLEGDDAAGDGIYTVRWTPPAPGRYSARFPNGDMVTVNALKAYAFSTAEYEWRNINGTWLTLTDESSEAVAPPFPVHFGGVTFSKLAVDSNGAIRMLAPNEAAGFGVSSWPDVLPTVWQATLVAPFWDDFILIPYTGREVRWAATGRAPNRELVIEWHHAPHYVEYGFPPPASEATFQVVFFESSDDILFNYADTDFGNGMWDYGAMASVGVQVSQSVAMQYSFAAPVLTPGLAVRWQLADSRPTSIELLWPNNGEVWRPGEQQTIAWSASGPAATRFRIELVKGDAVDTVIAESVAASDRWYRWTMPQDQAHGSDYKIRLVSNSNPSVSHISARSFTVDNQYVLTVWGGGYGSDGRITSTPPGIDCHKACSAAFPAGTIVTLTATPAAGSYLEGWYGACTGTGACLITMNEDTFVEGAFWLLPGLYLFRPFGGEIWTTGQQGIITWVAETIDVGPTMRIELLKGGVLSRTIAAAAPSQPSYFIIWTLPVLPGGDDYQVRITSTTNAAYTDTSDLFSIDGPTLTLTSPNGGEFWPPGTTQMVRWNSNLRGNVLIYLYKGGKYDRTLSAGTLASNGAYQWAVAATQPQGTDYTVRIFSATDSTVADTSDGNFNILPLQITLTSPNGGELWRPGTTHAITWTATGPVGTDAKIELMNGTAVASVIAAAVPLSTGTYPWTVPADQAHGSYSIRITSNQMPAIFDSSNAAFVIDDLYAVTVTKAGNGSGTVASSPVGINCGASCKANFSSGSVVTLTATPVTGHQFSGWSGACTGTAACVLNLDNDKAVTATFTILPPGITVVSPNGGENWQPGSSQTVRWTARSAGTYVRIDLYKNGVFNRALAASALASTGSFTWTVPATQPQGTDYKVRVASTTNAAYFDLSDATFSILPLQVTVTSPNGGELWRPGTAHAITWTATGPVGNDAKIELLNGTVVDSVLAGSVPLVAGTYPWTVPAGQAHGSAYKIRISSNHMAAIFDSSNTAFAIDDLYAVTVSKAGTGAGTVTSSPVGINCGSSCKANFSSGATVTLTATPAPGHTHTGWSGHCTGTGPCVLGMDGDKAVTATFAAPPTGIVVTSPNGGEDLAAASSYLIRWTYTGSVGSYVRVELLKGAAVNRVLALVPVSTGSYSWNIPANQATGSDYFVRVTSTSNATYTDTSDAAFRITGPGFMLTSPNGGEQWQPGSAQIIRWNYTGPVGTYVRLYLYKGGVLNRLITMSAPVGTAGTGSYAWTIPTAVLPGADYRIAVMSTTNGSYTDQSDANFSIVQ